MNLEEFKNLCNKIANTQLTRMSEFPLKGRGYKRDRWNIDGRNRYGQTILESLPSYHKTTVSSKNGKHFIWNVYISPEANKAFSEVMKKI